jgi:mono/diheme cytochrome c family protein
MVRTIRLLLPCLLTLLVSTSVDASETATSSSTPSDSKPAGSVDYLKQVKPLLTARCVACHGSLKQAGGLRLDTAAAIRAGGDSGAAADPKDVSASVILERISDKDPATRMPPEGEGAALKPDEIALIRAWIAAGAVGPADEKPEADPREHWAFRAPVRPPVPSVKNSAWVRNPIDAFLAAELEKHSLQPQPAAERGLLLRRLYLDLIGLPPTRAQLTEFLNDKSPDAYERVVDQLLASKQYGERWGRHWMDIWRYSDWWGLGAQVRNSQKHIWHWRDWIIESLNEDLAYDEMVRLMLSADETHPDDLDKLRATGFLVRSYFLFNRNTWLEGVVEHTSKGILGLTMNCAKCHDHKYDPISQKDYYRFRAFFEPYQVRTDLLPGEADYEKDGLPRAFDGHPDAPTYLYVRGDEFKPLKDDPLSPGFPKLITPPGEWSITPVKLPQTAYQPGLRPWIYENQIHLAELQIKQAGDALKSAEQALAAAEKMVKKPAGKAKDAAQLDALLDDNAKLGKPTKAAPPKPAASATGTAAAPTPSLAELRLAVVAAEKTLAAAEAALPVVKARHRADGLRADGKSPEFKQAADAACIAERKLGVAKAAQLLAENELRLLREGETKKLGNDKRVKESTDALKKAEELLAAKPDGKYTPLPGALKAFESSTETEDERRKPFPTSSTGRRTALAKLLTDRNNPLTARVAVNHIWTRHMGKPLVPTMFEFGRKGTPPTHPELLDWLAIEFMDRGWSMKQLHRLIVTSNAYRMSSSADGAELALKSDPDNLYYWRMNPIRVEAQVVRDSLLHLTGELDLTLGGANIDPTAQEFSKRRSLYFTHSHNTHHRFLTMFDDADVLECYRRDQSIVPQQALALANAKQAIEASEKLTAQLEALPDAKDEDAFIREAFRTILCCEPNADELAACRDALADWRKLPLPTGISKQTRARTNLVHALLNHNDFVTVK